MGGWRLWWGEGGLLLSPAVSKEIPARAVAEGTSRQTSLKILEMKETFAHLRAFRCERDVKSDRERTNTVHPSVGAPSALRAAILSVKSPLSEEHLLNKISHNESQDQVPRPDAVGDHQLNRFRAEPPLLRDKTLSQTPLKKWTF